MTKNIDTTSLDFQDQDALTQDGFDIILAMALWMMEYNQDQCSVLNKKERFELALSKSNTADGRIIFAVKILECGLTLKTRFIIYKTIQELPSEIYAGWELYARIRTFLHKNLARVANN